MRQLEHEDKGEDDVSVPVSIAKCAPPPIMPMVVVGQAEAASYKKVVEPKEVVVDRKGVVGRACAMLTEAGKATWS